MDYSTSNSPNEPHYIDALDHESGLIQFQTGAIRGVDADDVRFDLMPPYALMRLAQTFCEGARKYGDRNWEKGIPASNLLNHALRHIYLWMAGDNSEDHMAHAVWNLMAILHFEETNPGLIDLPARQNHY